MPLRPSHVALVPARLGAKISERVACVLCYLLGPVSGTLFLSLHSYSHIWAVRFHAFDSILMASVWALASGSLRLLSHVSPWFPGAILQEMRLALDLGFALIWILLMISAYQGRRCAAVPSIHWRAVRLARRYEKHIGRASRGSHERDGVLRGRATSR